MSENRIIGSHRNSLAVVIEGKSPSPQLVASTKLDTAHDGQLCSDATDDPRPLDSRVWRGLSISVGVLARIDWPVACGR